MGDCADVIDATSLQELSLHTFQEPMTLEKLHFYIRIVECRMECCFFSMMPNKIGF